MLSNNLISHYFTKRKVISVFLLVCWISVVSGRDLSCANAKYFTNPGKVSVDLMKTPVNGKFSKYLIYLISIPTYLLLSLYL